MASAQLAKRHFLQSFQDTASCKFAYLLLRQKNEPTFISQLLLSPPGAPLAARPS